MEKHLSLINFVLIFSVLPLTHNRGTKILPVPLSGEIKRSLTLSNTEQLIDKVAISPGEKRVTN